jgi:hypothetical protein
MSMIEGEVEVLEIDAPPQERGDRFAARTDDLHRRHHETLRRDFSSVSTRPRRPHTMKGSETYEDNDM